MDPQDIPLHRLYHDLAYLWPAMSPPEDYAEEAAHWRAVLRERLGPGRHRLLELGVGGGHNLSRFADEFEVVAADLSEAMLAHSHRLNPSVEHVVGDMRSLRLGRTFDAVLIHDAISHLTTEDDLAATFATAAAHLEAGGLFIATPDDYRETFRSPRVTHDTGTHGDLALTYVEFAHDPDPDDTTLETLFTYFITEKGRLRIEHDRFLTGLFPRATWRRLMAEAGFEVETRAFELEGGVPYEMLVGTKAGRPTA